MQACMLVCLCVRAFLSPTGIKNQQGLQPPLVHLFTVPESAKKKNLSLNTLNRHPNSVCLCKRTDFSFLFSFLFVPNITYSLVGCNLMYLDLYTCEMFSMFASHRALLCFINK